MLNMKPNRCLPVGLHDLLEAGRELVCLEEGRRHLVGVDGLEDGAYCGAAVHRCPLQRILDLRKPRGPFWLIPRCNAHY